jgi:hypothetical protein
MERTIDSVRIAFADRVAGVIGLLEFDNFVVDHLVGGLSGVVEELESKRQNSAAQVVSNRLKALTNIRSAQALRPMYGTIHNQCVVLLVSYFDATMGDLFRAAIACALKAGRDVPAGDRSVELSWRSLSKPDAPLEALIAERIVDQDDISFQDMQSIRRAFSKNLGLDLGRGENANDVIVGQAARHVMAHAGGIIDDRFRKQISAAHPRRIKNSLPASGAIEFEPHEVRVLAESMTGFVTTAIEQVRQFVGFDQLAG